MPLPWCLPTPVLFPREGWTAIDGFADQTDDDRIFEIGMTEHIEESEAMHSASSGKTGFDATVLLRTMTYVPVPFHRDILAGTTAVSTADKLPQPPA